MYGVHCIIYSLLIYIGSLLIVVTSQDFFDSRIMDAIRRQLTVFSTGRQFSCEVSGNDISFEHTDTVSLHPVVCCVMRLLFQYSC